MNDLETLVDSFGENLAPSSSFPDFVDFRAFCISFTLKPVGHPPEYPGCH